MKFMIALALLAVAGAAPQRQSTPIEIISSNSQTNTDGSYAFDYETANGIKVSESGSQKQIGPNSWDIITVAQGSYSYTSPEGIFITVVWIADENGFRTLVNNVPIPPSAPASVVKMLGDLKNARLP